MKLFFRSKLPEGSVSNWSEIDWSSTIFNEPNFFSWTNWHMFLAPTTIGCWGKVTCSITSFRKAASVSVALCNVSRYVTKSRDMRESDLVREMFVRTVLLQSADMLYDRRCL